MKLYSRRRRWSARQKRKIRGKTTVVRVEGLNKVKTKQREADNYRRGRGKTMKSSVCIDNGSEKETTEDI